MNPGLIISVTSLVFCCFFFLYFRSYINRRTATEEILAEYRAEVRRLIAEIDSATDRDALLVEERIKTLKSILDDTDKRIAVYTRELQRSRSGEALYTNLGRGIRAALDQQPAPPVQAPPAAPINPAGAEAQPLSPLKAARPVMLPDSKQAAPARSEKTEGSDVSPAAKPETSPPRLRFQIAELASGGLSPGKIASRLNISLTEVETALNLMGHGDL